MRWRTAGRVAARVVDDALRVVERMLGPADSPGRWDRPTTGVPLTAGVGEIELASAFRPYTELSVDLHDRPGFAFAAAVGIRLTIRSSSTGGDHATAHRP